ncbi:MAG TPA: hypothetical protein VIL30_05910 [Ramlibacter sp.]|jgi:hypothetical protein
MNAFTKQFWNGIGGPAFHFKKLTDVTTHDDRAYTRPYLHILLDIIEFGQRAPGRKGARFLNVLLGDELAGEFLVAALDGDLIVMRRGEGA